MQVDRDTQNFLDTTNGGTAVLVIRNSDGSITMARITDTHIHSSVGDQWGYASFSGHLSGTVRGADLDGSTLPGILLDAADRLLRFPRFTAPDPELPGAGALIGHWYRVVDSLTEQVMAEGSDPEETAKAGAGVASVRFEQLRVRALYEPWSPWAPEFEPDDDEDTPGARPAETDSQSPLGFGHKPPLTGENT